MHPKRYVEGVKPAGISTKTGEKAIDCFKSNTDYKGGDVQLAYRSHKLGNPGERMHVPGIVGPQVDNNLVFGIKTGSKNCSTAECIKAEPEHVSQSYKHFIEESESTYESYKKPVGKTPQGQTEIPEKLMKNGFGVSTRFSESAGTVIQNTKQDILQDPRVQTSYQAKRNYDWKTINPNSHTFGIKSEGNIDHVNEVFRSENEQHITAIAVDRAKNSAIVPDPDPVNPRPRTTMRTMGGKQVRNTRDPAELPPAGLPTTSIEFCVGDTITGLGLMDSFSVDRSTENKQWTMADDMVHGIKTKPNPFPNPLRGNGKYSSLGLSEEDFLLLRSKGQILPIMTRALGISDEKAIEIFDTVSQRVNRQKISVSEFHQQYKLDLHYRFLALLCRPRMMILHTPLE